MEFNDQVSINVTNGTLSFLHYKYIVLNDSVVALNNFVADTSIIDKHYREFVRQ